MKAPPPFSPAIKVKRQILPRPTALPMAARINPMRVANLTPGSAKLKLLVCSFYMSLCYKPKTRFAFKCRIASQSSSDNVAILFFAPSISKT